MHSSELLEQALRLAKKFIPKRIFGFFQPAYHYLLAAASGLLYGFPSKKLFVIGVTGTKGKTSTAEIVNAILEAEGLRTALAGTLRFKIGEESRNNLYKMTMPGRFFLQRFLRQAVQAGCTHAVIEMTSEGSKQSRYRFIYPDALIFTNLAPEHIESHGSYEKYVEAKLDIGRRVERSGKPRRILVVNADDREAGRFLALGAPEKYEYSLAQAEPYRTDQDGVSFSYEGERFESALPGTFNIYNILAGITLGKALGFDYATMRRGVGAVRTIRGRMEKVTAKEPSLAALQDFSVVVDYAHTPDSLEKAYGVFTDSRMICVLGGTGGGRDTKKRAVMGGIANRYCSEIILTDEDPYDEDPARIVSQIADGIADKKPTIEMDRRKAIRLAIEKARTGDTVIVTGKGTDPYIMGANGAKTPWSDASVAREELEAVLSARSHGK